MVIILTPQGQLANRLIHTGHFIANAIYYNYPLYHLSFKDYYPFFNEQLKLSSTKKYIRFVNINNKIIKWIIKLFIKMIRKVCTYNNGNFLFFFYIYIPGGSWRNQISYDLTSASFIKKTKKITFVDGWEFHNELLFKKYRDKIIDIFKPNKRFRDEADNIIARFRENYTMLVGVHIRRGDYIHFDNGAYYYDDSLYQERMQQVKQFNSMADENILFVICSNEKMDKDSFGSLNTDCSERHFMLDLLILSACDLIMGPPSTFSMWASYYGAVPLCQVMPGNQKLSVDNFSIYGK